MGKIRVLVVDDSAVVRKFITEELAKTKDIEVIATAMDPFIAAEKIKNLQPDVLTLDIEMPKMDGLTFLEKLMLIRPMPVIMVSSLTEKGAKETFRALEMGAVDYILKPDLSRAASEISEFAANLSEKIRAASGARIHKSEKPKMPIMTKPNIKDEKGVASNFVIAIGASTGGTEVISAILTSLPENVPGIVITQHMPPKFTEAFANRIDTMSKIRVKEAVKGEKIYNGFAYIAPGGTQMLVRSTGTHYWLDVTDDPPRNRHKPSVDVLFDSVVSSVGSNSIGIILTGMGADGAVGLLNMKDAGCYTIAQNEESCVVFGMPREAIKIGGASSVKNIEQIINYLIMNYQIK